MIILNKKILLFIDSISITKKDKEINLALPAFCSYSFSRKSLGEFATFSDCFILLQFMNALTTTKYLTKCSKMLQNLKKSCNYMCSDARSIWKSLSYAIVCYISKKITAFVCRMLANIFFIFKSLDKCTQISKKIEKSVFIAERVQSSSGIADQIIINNFAYFNKINSENNIKVN